MQKLTVAAEDLHRQSAAVKTGAADVQDILSRLTSQIAELASNWQGGASSAFQSRWQEWQNGANTVQQAMQDMGTFLEQAALAYEQTESSIQSAAGN